MYNKELAAKILHQLNEFFPTKVGLAELRSALPQFAGLTEEDWLLALDAMNKDGLVGGVFSRLGGDKVLRKAWNLEITPIGRQQLDANRHGKSAVALQLDDLLQICTRGQFDSDLEELSTTATSTRPLSLIMADLDDFKAVNDAYGHPLGDQVLQKTASVIKSACEPKGRCYRYGGEEIALLLPNYTLQEAAALAERVRREIYTIDLEGRPERITASLGVACYPETTQTPAGLVRDADRAMYRAKTAGKNQVSKADVTTKENGRKVELPPPGDIQRRVDAVRVSASIQQGFAQWFVISVGNDSDEDVTIKEIRLESRGISLTRPARPKSENPWNVQPRNNLQIGWSAQPDPARSLLQLNPNAGVCFEAEVQIILLSEILGRTREFTSRLWVQVDAQNLHIRQLVG
jgi:diguanylate cyclase (GGDEF)-like protein